MKELIYFKLCDLKPEGGPAGYLYNLHAELERESISWISFVPTVEKPAKKIFNRMPSFIKKPAKTIKKYVTRNKVLDVLNDNIPKRGFARLDDYDVVHFHSTLTMYKTKDLLDEYNGVVILTSHSPKILSKEIAEDYTRKKDYERHKAEYDKLVAIDNYAFNRADRIIFPCKESEEPYYHTWKDYKKIHETNKNKYIYIPTGISSVDTGNFSRKKIREKYGIPDNKFVVCYIGRHNKVKGYDQLKDIASKVLKNSNIEAHFLIAGKEAPLTGLKNKNWTEAGWINNPNELIFAADAFVLPNQETYFDLILLQAMSIGKPIILTNTGGNKYFKKFKESGLFFYDYGDINGAANIIKKLSKSSKGDISKYGEANKKIFEENFTIEIFAKKYIEEITKIGSGKK